MEDMKKHREEELRELANKGWGALSWIKLSELGCIVMDKTIRTIREEIRKRENGKSL
jgi:hypothetical protein